VLERYGRKNIGVNKENLPFYLKKGRSTKQGWGSFYLKKPLSPRQFAQTSKISFRYILHDIRAKILFFCIYFSLYFPINAPERKNLLDILLAKPRKAYI